LPTGGVQGIAGYLLVDLAIFISLRILYS